MKFNRHGSSIAAEVPSCQISEQSDYSKYKSRGIETSQDLTIRRLIGYWNGAQAISLQIKCIGILLVHEPKDRAEQLVMVVTQRPLGRFTPNWSLFFISDAFIHLTKAVQMWTLLGPGCCCTQLFVSFFHRQGHTSDAVRVCCISSYAILLSWVDMINFCWWTFKSFRMNHITIVSSTILYNGERMFSYNARKTEKHLFCIIYLAFSSNLPRISCWVGQDLRGIWLWA